LAQAVTADGVEQPPQRPSNIGARRSRKALTPSAASRLPSTVRFRRRIARRSADIARRPASYPRILGPRLGFRSSQWPRGGGVRAAIGVRFGGGRQGNHAGSAWLRGIRRPGGNRVGAGSSIGWSRSRAVNRPSTHPQT